MSPAPDQIDTYLSSEESLTGVYTGTCAEGSAPASVTIGVTDDRLLYLTEDGSFVSADHDSISAIRSRERTTLGYRGTDYRLLVAGGALLSALGAVTTLLLTAGVLVPLLVAITAGALGTAAFVWDRQRAGERVVTQDVVGKVDAAFDGDDVRRYYERHVPDDVDGDQFLLAACGVVATLALVATLATNPLLVVAPLLVTGGGVVAAYAHRRRQDLDGIEVTRRREQEIRISTEDGREVQFRSDPSARIDRELSRQVFVDRTTPASRVTAGSEGASAVTNGQRR